MKNVKRYLRLSLAGALCLPAAAYAEMIQGMITHVDTANDMLSIRQTSAPAGSPQEVNVRVKSDTKTTNVASLHELQVGQEVKIDAQGNTSAGGVLEAKTIEVTGGTPVAATAGMGIPGKT